ncbi:PREDICTED: probable G-protein coupled receptor 150 [Gekko japonicus]|uniref:Probable G-protein coupled receptor 150 n=1 Tax=Gekko japonicus TaxID=146911 RepID=A0ABM1LCJ1_GEKJA|nr:PREDICTED: probable G-protein coupled receptor 150 [Gekko japonicus]
MDDASNPDSLALGPNLSSAQYPGWNSNLSFPSLWATPGQSARTISVAVIMLLGLVGNALLLHRLRCGGCCCAGRFARRRKMDFLLAHLAVADLYGCGLAFLAQFPPAADAGGEAEPGEAEWPAGDATCRFFRLLQGSGLLAPSHMLVLLALERHHLVRGPQHLQPPQASFMAARGALAALGWLLTLLLALPQAFVYRLAPPQDGSRCLSIFAQLPPWHGQAYAVYGVVTSFVAPACLLGGTCGRMLSALSASSAKEEEPSRGAGGSSRRHRLELPGSAAPPPLLLRLLPVAKCALPSPSAPRSLPRARARALQLTLALTTHFALCGFPRFVLELGLAFASPASTAEEARTTLGSIMAAANCALNPYVCLIFHSHRPWARRLQSNLCRCPDGQPRRRAPHRHRPPPPQVAAERAGRWLCPCQTKPPTASAVAQQQEEAEARAPVAFESGL